MTRVPFPTGYGIFETMRVENGKVAELGRHMRRAVSSARDLSIPVPDEDFLRSQISQTIAGDSFEIGRLRICFSALGLDLSYSRYVDEIEPARLTFHTISSSAEGALHKSYPYDANFAILDEAVRYGFDDAIVFNSRNEVSETAIANIALLIDNRWVTPPLSAGVLPGVMRAIAIERCNLAVAPIHISEIARCEGALLLNSLKLARPVSYIGDYQLPGLTSMLEKASVIREKVHYFSVS